jgi:hypothetical protein
MKKGNSFTKVVKARKRGKRQILSTSEWQVLRHEHFTAERLENGRGEEIGSAEDAKSQHTNVDIGEKAKWNLHCDHAWAKDMKHGCTLSAMSASTSFIFRPLLRCGMAVIPARDDALTPDSTSHRQFEVSSMVIPSQPS